MFRAGANSSVALALLVFTAFESPDATAGAAKPEVAARVGAIAVSNREVDMRASVDLARDSQEFEAAKRQLERRHARRIQVDREAALNSILDDRVLALEAAALNTTPRELLEKIPVPLATPEEIRAFYIMHQTDFAAPLSDIAAQVQNQLKEPAQQNARAAYVRSLRQKYQVVVEFEPVRDNVVVTEPIRGVVDSPVTIVEFSDFQCHDCRRFDLALKKVLDQYRGKVRVAYRHMPQAPLHDDAQKAAEAAVCSQFQGKFWEMHDLMLKEQSKLSVEQLKDKAKRLELDTNAFNDCLDQGAAKAAIATDVGAAEQLGIERAPTSFVNGRYVEGVIPESELVSLIEDELLRVERAAKR